MASRSNQPVSGTTSQIVSQRQRNLTLCAVGVVSASGLIYEITLTRVFSLYFQYHFAFLAVSLAVLGLSFGAAWGTQIKQQAALRQEILVQILGFTSLSFVGATAILSWLPSAETIYPHAVVAIVPFVFMGLFMALAFGRFAESGGLFYGADLMGAAVGVLLVLALLSLISSFSVLLILGVALGGLCVALAYGDSAIDRKQFRREMLLAPIALIAALIVLALNLFTGIVDFDPSRLYDAPRDKTMLTILKDPTQNGSIILTKWSPFARVDVLQTNDPDARYVFTDGGAGSYMMNARGNLASLKSAVEYAPFAIGKPGNALILGAGGGKDIVMAQLAGIGQITAVEINPAVIAATRAMADYNGDILNKVDFVEADARNYAERSDRQYDLIYLNLVYTQAADFASQALAENYVFTTEGFRTYLDRLSAGGHLAIVTHSALEGSRAAVTALQALELAGVPPQQALDHMLFWMLGNQDPTLRTSVLIVGKQPLTDTAKKELTAFARPLGMQPLFMPGEYEDLFKKLRTTGVKVSDFVDADASYDLSPTYDDRPFFYQLDKGLPPAISSALLFSALIALAVTVGGLTMVASKPAKTGKTASKIARPAETITSRRWIVYMAYAALIGLAFMLIEIPLIQRFQLAFGYPILSIATVLGSLLLFGGIGSLISQRWSEAQLPRRAALAAVIIGGVALIYRFVLPSLVEGLLGTDLIVRLVVIIALTALIAVPMGIMFPSLMRLIGQNRERIALIWALNGAFSVVGSTLAVALAMIVGFGAVLLMGGGLYLVLAGLIWSTLRT